MKENSIEEDIKIVENYLANSAMNEIDSNFFKNSGWETVDLEIPKSMQYILSDYKRVLKENEELKEYIAIAPNLDEMTATKYRNIQQDAYIQGRAEEQQKAEQIIYENYISIQKVKDKISERQFELQQEYKDFEDDAILIVLQELLEGRK